MKMQIRTGQAQHCHSHQRPNKTEREKQKKETTKKKTLKKNSDHSVGTRALAGTLQQGVKLFAGMMD